MIGLGSDKSVCSIVTLAKWGSFNIQRSSENDHYEFSELHLRNYSKKIPKQNSKSGPGFFSELFKITMISIRYKILKFELR